MAVGGLGRDMASSSQIGRLRPHFSSIVPVQSKAFLTHVKELTVILHSVDLHKYIGSAGHHTSTVRRAWGPRYGMKRRRSGGEPDLI